MSNDALKELHSQHRNGQEKYTYFLLGAAGATVGFALQQTSGMKMGLPMIPLGIAVLLWGLSFYFGCRNLLWVQTSIMANYSLLQLQKGVHAEQPDHPELLAAAMRGVRSALDSNIKRAQFSGIWQFRLLIAGAVFYVAWHILEMAIRTFSP